MSCPRNMTKEEMIERLKKGWVLFVDRIDAPELSEVQELEAEGLVKTQLEEYPEQQYSRLRVWWNTDAEKTTL